MNRCPSVVIHAACGNEWYEGVLQAQLYRLVGTLIVHTEIDLAEDEKKRATQLSNLKSPAIRLMSGISTIIALSKNGKSYLYRGVPNILPLVPPSCSFAQEIDMKATIEMHLSREAPLSIGSFVDVNFKNVLLSSGATVEPTVENVMGFLKADDLTWNTVLSQISVCLSSSEIDTLKDKLSAEVLRQQEITLEAHKAKERQLIDDLRHKFSNVPVGVDATLYTSDTRDLIFAHKKTIKDAQEPFRVLLGRINQIFSFKVSSARNVGVQQAQRRQQIDANVKETNDMTPDQLAGSLSSCTWGFAVAKIDARAVMEMLNAVSRSQIDDYLQKIATPTQVWKHGEQPPVLHDIRSAIEKNAIGFHTAHNCMTLDSDSVECLLKHNSDSHELSSTKHQMTFVLQNTPHIVLPLFSDASKLDGSYVDFMNDANIPHISHFRIALRGMLSSLRARCPIGVKSVDLTFGIQSIVLSLMMSMVKGVNIETLDTESTVCQMLRSLMYLWGTFAGSTKTPVTFAYQLLQPGAKIAQPRKRGEWVIYALVSFLYPFLKLPMESFKSNIRVLLVDMIFKRVVSDLLAEKKQKVDPHAHTKNRNLALRWNYVACYVLSRLDRQLIDLPLAQSAAKNLLDKFPDVPTYTSTQLRRTLTFLMNNEDINWRLVRICIACATIKRSGCFAKAKKARTISALEKAKDKLRETLKLDPDHPLTVQNESAYTEKDMQRMLSDAELKRHEWSVNGETPQDGLSNSDFLREMLPSLVTAESKTTVQELLVVSKAPGHISSNKNSASCMGNCRQGKTRQVRSFVVPPHTLRSNRSYRRVTVIVAIASIVRILMATRSEAESKKAAVQFLHNEYDNTSLPGNQVRKCCL